MSVFVKRFEVGCMGCGSTCGTCPFKEMEDEMKKKVKAAAKQ